MEEPQQQNHYHHQQEQKEQTLTIAGGYMGLTPSLDWVRKEVLYMHTGTVSTQYSRYTLLFMYIHIPNIKCVCS